ncbi:MAG TPA: error-prone DNA polymerase [Caulobacteraceae bacterium]|jgi:error-prone DNA polymerase
MTAYAELQVTSNFSFLRGASHPQELVFTAAALGHAAIGITDRNSLAGVVRAWTEAKASRIRLLVGCRLDFADGTPSVLCYPTDREAYGRLTRLLSAGQLRAKKGECRLTYADLLEHGEGQVLIVVAPAMLDARFEADLERLARDFRGSVYLAAARSYAAQDARGLHRLNVLARAHRAPMVAVNDVLYHAPERRPLQDVVTCVREKCTLAAAGLRLEPNGERHLKPPAEMARLFKGWPDALARTLEIVGRCRFDLSQLKYEYPDEPVPPGWTAIQHLTRLAWDGAKWRYPDGVPKKVEELLRKELRLIKELNYPNYFLTVHDIVKWARSQEEPILCQGRGSAANSIVCFCLGVTAVDPTKPDQDLLFARFLSKERSEPPDIDVDFEHERREEVMQYVFGRYGRHRAAICATVIHYRPRSASREVGKALGLTEDVTAALADTVWGSWGDEMPEGHVRQAGFDPANPEIARAVDLANQLLGFPRHLSQHVGGFVLTKRRLDETVPIGNGAMKDRTFIEWDKDDIDELGLMKVDVLALGMLSCIRRAFDLLRSGHGIDFPDLAAVPQECPKVYEMLSAADSVGVFQVESRAQMSMLPRLRPRRFYDLVIEVAIVRPGPIQGDMVHPYLKRREGREPVEYPSPAPPHDPNELREVLGKTLGVPLFQEQAMRLAIEAAKFTDEEANGLRRAMATFKHLGDLSDYREKFIGGMVARGYEEDFARRCFKQIEGFGSYGFPESHAISFAILVYVSAWLKCWWPDVFCAAILNSQPMGFYQPAQLVRDAREHGVEVRAPDILHSDWDCTLEDPTGRLRAVRLGLRSVKGLPEAHAQAIVEARQAGARTLAELARGSRAPRHVFERLADADAFRSLGMDRRAALWAVKGLETADEGLLDQAARKDAPVQLPLMPLPEHVAEDYRTISLSLKAHPVGFFRPMLKARKVVTAEELKQPRLRDGRRVTVAGLVLIRQRPGTAKGVTFLTLEDETGSLNLIVWQDRFEARRKTWMTGSFLLVRGVLQKANGVIHVVSEEVEDLSHVLSDLRSAEAEPPRIRSDVQGRLLRSRDFH